MVVMVAFPSGPVLVEVVTELVGGGVESVGGGVVPEHVVEKRVARLVVV